MLTQDINKQESQHKTKGHVLACKRIPFIR